MRLRRLAVVEDGARSSWFARHRAPWWVWIVTAIGLAWGWALLRWRGL